MNYEQPTNLKEDVNKFESQETSQLDIIKKEPNPLLQLAEMTPEQITQIATEIAPPAEEITLTRSPQDNEQEWTQGLTTLGIQLAKTDGLWILSDTKKCPTQILDFYKTQQRGTEPGSYQSIRLIRYIDLIAVHLSGTSDTSDPRFKNTAHIIRETLLYAISKDPRKQEAIDRIQNTEFISNNPEKNKDYQERSLQALLFNSFPILPEQASEGQVSLVERLKATLLSRNEKMKMPDKNIVGKTEQVKEEVPIEEYKTEVRERPETKSIPTINDLLPEPFEEIFLGQKEGESLDGLKFFGKDVKIGGVSYYIHNGIPTVLKKSSIYEETYAREALEKSGLPTSKFKIPRILGYASPPGDSLGLVMEYDPDFDVRSKGRHSVVLSELVGNLLPEHFWKDKMPHDQTYLEERLELEKGSLTKEKTCELILTYFARVVEFYKRTYPNLIHGDFNLNSNFLLCKGGKLAVLDFGECYFRMDTTDHLNRVFDELKKSGARLGKTANPQWVASNAGISPSQIVNEETFSEALLAKLVTLITLVDKHDAVSADKLLDFISSLPDGKLKQIILFEKMRDLRSQLGIEQPVLTFESVLSILENGLGVSYETTQNEFIQLLKAKEAQNIKFAPYSYNEESFPKDPEKDIDFSPVISNSDVILKLGRRQRPELILEMKRTAEMLGVPCKLCLYDIYTKTWLAPTDDHLSGIEDDSSKRLFLSFDISETTTEVVYEVGEEVEVPRSYIDLLVDTALSPENLRNGLSIGFKVESYVNGKPKQAIPLIVKGSRAIPVILPDDYNKSELLVLLIQLGYINIVDANPSSDELLTEGYYLKFGDRSDPEMRKKLQPLLDKEELKRYKQPADRK